MLLHRVLVVEHVVPPVEVTVVQPLVHSVANLFDDPRTVRVLDLVVHSGEEPLHIGIIVEDIVGTLRCLAELVDRIDGPVTPGLIIGGGSRLFPAPASAVTND